MTVLPIIERELRVRARGRAAYRMRSAVALLGLLVCLPALLLPRPFSGAAAPGPGLLTAMLSAAFLLCCGSCLLTADIISSERREGTLGLLLLTRVRLFDVLIGKLGSAGLASLCALLAFLPLLMLPVLAGGVTGGEVFRKGLVLPNTLFLALAAGFWASAGGRERLKTARTALLLVAALVLGPGLAELLLACAGAPRTGIGFLSPLGALAGAGDPQYKLSPDAYWLSLLVMQAAAWALLAGAVVRLRRSWRQDQGEAAVSASAKASVAERQAALPPSRPLGDTDPIAWLFRRQRGTAGILWAAALVSFAFHLWPWVVFRFWSPRSSYWMLTVPLSLAATALDGALFAWAASRFFVEARRSGELELLLTTPCGAGQLVSAQWDVLKRLLRGPMVLMLVPVLLWIVSMLAGGFHRPGMPGSVITVRYTISPLLSIVNLLFSVGAICWLGMWFGLRAGGQGRAIAWTVVLARGLPYLLSLLSWMVFSLVGVFSSRWLGGAVPYLIQSLPQVVNLVFFVSLIHLARRRLLSGLAGADPMHLDLRQAFSSAARDAGAALRKARHWTPS